MAQYYKVPPGKILLELCTKAGNSPYNKGGTFALVESDKIVDLYKYKGGQLAIMRPVIDKLIFEYHFKDCGTNRRNIQQACLENADKSLKQTPLLKKATKTNVGEQRLFYLNKYYKENFVLIFKPTGSKVIFQLEPHNNKKAFLRCELNPARLGTNGMNFFRDFLKILTCNEWQEITFETISKIPKTIKRIDIAVDMLGVDASDLEGRYVFKGKKLKKTPVQNPTGRLETMYFRMPENDKNEAYWYNKKVQIKEVEKDPVDGGQKSPYGAALYTRYEYRILETDKPIARLRSLINHLPKVHFKAIDYTKLKNKDYTHFLFLRYAILRTPKKALEMIPKELQKDFEASYKKAAIDIWKPDVMWEKGWKPELERLGLYIAAKKKKSQKKKT